MYLGYQVARIYFAGRAIATSTEHAITPGHHAFVIIMIIIVWRHEATSRAAKDSDWFCWTFGAPSEWSLWSVVKTVQVAVTADGGLLHQPHTKKTRRKQTS